MSDEKKKIDRLQMTLFETWAIIILVSIAVSLILGVIGVWLGAFR